jgi:hypothetical protein
LRETIRVIALGQIRILCKADEKDPYLQKNELLLSAGLTQESICCITAAVENRNLLTT